MSFDETGPMNDQECVTRLDKKKKNRIVSHGRSAPPMCRAQMRIVSEIIRVLCLGLLAIGFTFQPVAAADKTPRAAPPFKTADFAQELPSREARLVADWVVDSGDNQSLPFVIVDKVNATVFVFNAGGGLQGATPALLGLASGDDAVPGIGKRPLSKIRPEERTTPAGRFVATLDQNLRGKKILWVDYDTAVSLHPVVTTNPKEHRALRLATATPLDNRISYGCINVPAKFFSKIVRPFFTGTNGIVYVLPEKKSPQEVFASYDVEERARLQSTR